MAKIIIEIEMQSKTTATILKPMLAGAMNSFSGQPGITSINTRIED